MAPAQPFREFYYWADAPPIPEAVSQFLWFAGAAGDGAAAAGMRALVSAINAYAQPNTTAVAAMNAPVALANYTTAGSAAEFEALPWLRVFQHQQLVLARSSWTDPNATFIGFKGLNVSWAWAHNHLDATAFVFLSHGQFWAQDLGDDSYALPSYFSPARFELYRTGTQGHNALSFDGANQQCAVTGQYTSECALSPLQSVNVTSNGGLVDAFAVVNVTAAYAYIPGVLAAARGFVIANNRTQLVTVDETVVDDAAYTGGVRWAMHTVANVNVAADGASVTLTTFNVSEAVTVALLAAPGQLLCAGGAFETVPVDLQPPMYPTPGVTRLQYVAPAAACPRLVIVVGVAPVVADGLGALLPLAEWEALGPLAV
jgi:hypothetical protein